MSKMSEKLADDFLVNKKHIWVCFEKGLDKYLKHIHEYRKDKSSDWDSQKYYEHDTQIAWDKGLARYDGELKISFAIVSPYQPKRAYFISSDKMVKKLQIKDYDDIIKIDGKVCFKLETFLNITWDFYVALSNKEHYSIKELKNSENEMKIERKEEDELDALFRM